MLMAVVGAHLRGLPLHSQLVERNARFVEATRTAPVYRFFALAGTTPPKPGLLRTRESLDNGIELEIYDLDPAAYASFVELVPPPLTIGNLELADGRRVKGFLVEMYATEGAADITRFGGWRAYLKSLGGT